MPLVNDIHSALNATDVRDVLRPSTLPELVVIVQRAATEHRSLSIAGGRHAMGGQQFCSGEWLVDMTGLNGVLDRDSNRGLLHIEAGADWPAIIAASHAMTAPDGRQWGIRQKQTGVDAVSLGGSISANAHGRGLLMAPLGDDIEALTLVDASGAILHCDRGTNAERFALAIGGYGLFGIIYSAVLRLAPRQRVRRLVDIIDLDDAVNAVFRRAEQGCLYGDFQFVIDHTDERNFLRRGVLACYQPCPDDTSEPEPVADLTPDTWLKLLQLAHDDKRRAFQLYAQHYLSTDGNRYWSDTHQLSTYLPSYAEFLDAARGGPADASDESLVIGEHYVPQERLLDFMAQARAILRGTGTEVIYGTIRSIRRDTVSFLPWADNDYVCIVFNLRTTHDDAGLARTASSFRALSDASTGLGGRFFLTYHRHASIEQVLTAYPRFGDFLQRKRAVDPDERFSSDWYRHYRDAHDAHVAATTAVA